MNPKCISILIAVVVIGTCGCARMQQRMADPAEAGETKVRLDQTPAAVRQTIERELVGAQLEDIARKERQGKIIYETDIIRNEHKWEVVVGEDGKIISKVQEGGAEEKKLDQDESAKAAAGWREAFNVNKADLAPTGNNPYLTIQPGKVLKLAHGKDRLTVSILPDTKTIDGVTTGVPLG